MINQIAAVSVSPMLPTVAADSNVSQSGGFQELLAQLFGTAHAEVPLANMEEMLEAMIAQILGEATETDDPQKWESLIDTLLQAAKKNLKEAETTLMDGSLLQLQGMAWNLDSGTAAEISPAKPTDQMEQIAAILMQSEQAPELVKQLKELFIQQTQQTPKVNEQVQKVQANLEFLEKLVQHDPVKLLVNQSEQLEFEQLQVQWAPIKDSNPDWQQAYMQMKQQVGVVDVTSKEKEVQLLKEMKQEVKPEEVVAAGTNLFSPVQISNVKELSKEFMVEQPVIQQISEEFQVQMANGKDEFVMKLKPEGLGEITVKMTMQESGKIALHIQTSSAVVKQLLNDELVQLKEALRPYQTEVHEVTTYVASEHFAQQQNQQPNRNAFTFHKANHIPFTEEAEEVQTAVVHGLNRLNTYV